MALSSLPDRTFSPDITGRVAIVLADFNQDIAEGLLSGCEDVLGKYPGVQWQVHRVPGAWEAPLMVQKLASMVQVRDGGEELRIFDVIICLGCVLKGDTHHFESVMTECARGCMEVSLQQDIPVVFEVFGVYDMASAHLRSRGETNKGIAAAQVALDWLEKFDS